MKSKEGLTLKAVRKSLPVRGAWVEINTDRGVLNLCRVAPRAGSVG